MATPPRCTAATLSHGCNATGDRLAQDGFHAKTRFHKHELSWLLSHRNPGMNRAPGVNPDSPHAMAWPLHIEWRG